MASTQTAGLRPATLPERRRRPLAALSQRIALTVEAWKIFRKYWKIKTALHKATRPDLWTFLWEYAVIPQLKMDFKRELRSMKRCFAMELDPEGRLPDWSVCERDLGFLLALFIRDALHPELALFKMYGRLREEDAMEGEYYDGNNGGFESYADWRRAGHPGYDAGDGIGSDFDIDEPAGSGPVAAPTAEPSGPAAKTA